MGSLKVPGLHSQMCSKNLTSRFIFIFIFFFSTAGVRCPQRSLLIYQDHLTGLPLKYTTRKIGATMSRCAKPARYTITTAHLIERDWHDLRFKMWCEGPKHLPRSTYDGKSGEINILKTLIKSRIFWNPWFDFFSNTTLFFCFFAFKRHGCVYEIAPDRHLNTSQQA